MMNRRVLHELSFKKYQPRKEVARHPADQQTLDFDSKVALTDAGAIYVIQDAERGRHIPIPIPQKNLAKRNELKLQQTHDINPKNDCTPASHVINVYLPYLSEQTCRYEPIDTPKYTIVINSDCQQAPRCHYYFKTGRRRPSTIDQQPSLKRRRQSDLLIFYCAQPYPILLARRWLRLSIFLPDQEVRCSSRSILLQVASNCEVKNQNMINKRQINLTEMGYIQFIGQINNILLLDQNRIQIVINEDVN